MGTTEHRRREVHTQNRTSPSAKTESNDASPYSDLRYWSIPLRKTRVQVCGVLSAPLLTPTTLVVVLGNPVEFGHISMLAPSDREDLPVGTEQQPTDRHTPTHGTSAAD